MDSARGLYSRLSGYNPDQDLDDELDSLLSLPNVNPNQPREWLHIDGHGKTSYALVDKHAVVAELGIHYRDLRILDPLVPTPYPTALFIRDKALVVNLESIRMIISADQVFVLSAPEPGQSLVVGEFPEPSNPFIRDLIARLTTTQSTSSRGASSIDRTLPFELRALEAALAHTCRSLEQESIQVERATLPALKSLMQKVSRQELDKVRSCKSNLNKMLARVLELKQELEGMLDDDQDMADMYLGRRQDAENTKEEEKARQAIEPPSPTASAVSMDSIEAADFMGQSPNVTPATHRLATDTPFGASDQQQDRPGEAAVERFSTIDEAAEDIADNWGKAPQPRRDATRHRHDEQGMGSHKSSSSLKVATSAPPMETPLLVSPPNRDASLSAAPSAPPTQFANTKNGKHHRGHKHEESKGKWRNKVKKISELLTVMDKMQAPGGLPFVNAQDISACEDLLEAYFMQVGFYTKMLWTSSLLSRLKVLYERIDDTEDLINIELDHRRNELVALDLVITAVSTMFAFVAMIGGIFGMNMKNGYEESHLAFLWATYGGTAGAVILFLGIILFARWKRLLFIPDATSYSSNNQK
ncbi:MAG: Magnesium transporter [Trebouxia sp. A1-2]|nr:MAG: Magnesium transporter [Trebouxia sp. A1-2]